MSIGRNIKVRKAKIKYTLPISTLASQIIITDINYKLKKTIMLLVIWSYYTAIIINTKLFLFLFLNPTIREASWCGSKAVIFFSLLSQNRPW